MGDTSEPLPEVPAVVPGAANTLANTLTNTIHAVRRAQSGPALVALDGRSATGKSTVARLVGDRMGALVIDGDDFYRGGTDASWDAITATQKMDLVIDWDADDGRLAAELTGGPAEVVVLEGAYSARPELADLLSLRVLLQLPSEIRRERLLRREGERYRAEWEARWEEAEDLYFETVMPPASFDLVLVGT